MAKKIDDKKQHRILPGADNEIREVDKEKRIMWHKISKEILDRYGTVIRLDGMDIKNFKKNPVVLYGHNYGGMNPLPVIGKNIGFKKEGKFLWAGTQFLNPEKDNLSGPLADLVNDLWVLDQKGILGWSLGFWVQEIEEKNEKGKDGESGKTWYDIKKWELYEYSNVILTGNQEAVNNAANEGLISQRFIKEMPVDLGLEKKSLGDPVEDEIGTIGDITESLELEAKTYGNEALGNKIEELAEPMSVVIEWKPIEEPKPAEKSKALDEIITRVRAIIEQNEKTRKLVRKYLAGLIISKEKDLKL